MAPDGIRLRDGTPGDAATIAAVATHVFLDTYAAEGVRPDLAREVFELCSAQAFAAALARPAQRFVLACRGDGVVGFAELLLEQCRPEIPGVSGAELVRLYVQPRSHGQGIGRLLVERSQALAREAGLPGLWLTVWDRNEPAIRFYRRTGFAEAGAGTYTFEDQVYGTRIFQKRLG